jgi:hypothetical protein
MAPQMCPNGPSGGSTNNLAYELADEHIRLCRGSGPGGDRWEHMEPFGFAGVRIRFGVVYIALIYFCLATFTMFEFKADTSYLP